MEEENSISSERSSTSSEDSAPYSPHYSSHATSPINSQEEEESSDDHRTKHQSLKKIESAPYLTPSSSEFSPLCPPKTLLKQAFYPKDGPIFGSPFPLSASPPWMRALRLCSYTQLQNSKISVSQLARLTDFVYVHHRVISNLMDTHCRSISTLMSLFLNWIFISAKLSLMG